MSLEKELEGVTNPVIDSPDDHTTADIDDTDSVDAGAGDAGDSAASAGEGSEPDAKKQDRPIENVRRELLRKLEESERKNALLFNQFMQVVQNSPAATASKKPSSLDELPLDQLEAQRGEVPQERLAEFDAYLIRRRIDEGVTAKLTKFQEEQKYQDERRKANQLAVDRFPQLANRGSELYSEVNRRLSQLDENYRKYNPRIVLNIAEDVASELGLQARKVSNRPRITSGPSSVRSEKPASVSSPSDNVIQDDAQYESIAKKLRHALKGRSFDKNRIMKRGAEYSAHLRTGQE